MTTRISALTLDILHTIFLDLLPFCYYHSPDVSFNCITSFFKSMMIFFNLFQHCIKEELPKTITNNGENKNNNKSLFEPIDEEDDDDDHSPFVDDDTSEVEARDDDATTTTPNKSTKQYVVRFAPSNDNQIIHPPSFNNRESSYSPERTTTPSKKSKKDGVITIPTSKPDREVIVTNDSVIVVTKDKVIVTKKPKYPGEKTEVIEMKRTPTKDRKNNKIRNSPHHRNKVLSPTTMTPATPFSSPSSITGSGVRTPPSPRSYTKSCHF